MPVLMHCMYVQVGAELWSTHPSVYKYHHVPAQDWPGQDLVSLFPQAFDFIDEGRAAGTFVGCMHYMSQSTVPRPSVPDSNTNLLCADGP